MLVPGGACREQRNLLGSHCWRLIFSIEAVWLFALAAAVRVQAAEEAAQSKQQHR